MLAEGVEPAVEIACCFDRRFAVAAAVMATSLLAHADPARRYVLHAFYDGADDRGLRLFARFAGTRLEVRVRRIDNPFAGRPTSHPNISPASFVRLSLPELLPDVARLLYLDADTLCLADVGALFDTPLEGAPLAAAPDLGMQAMLAAERAGGREGSPEGMRRYLETRLGLDPERTPYFNAGVLVLDLARLRGDDLAGRAGALLDRAGGALRYDDQCVLNALYAAAYRPLDGRWNAMLHPAALADYAPGGVALMRQVAEARSEPAILHFNWTAKPWVETGAGAAFAATWRAYAFAAPLPWRETLRLVRGRGMAARYLRPSVLMQAAALRRRLRRPASPRNSPPAAR